ncbi:Mo-dependent nitrogenase-like protein [Leptolyngbyaceae cyanobacterium JSC-12]|nr:Mo-dependent nitrogenase-like protein [Leptolyngbyaceae cyanobacterium JSC-12]
MLSIVLASIKHSSPSNFSVFASKSITSPLHTVRLWLNQLEISHSAIAWLLCRIIPAQCPFERKVQFLGRTIIQIPPLCKLNPFYEEVVGLRFRALCYLVEHCSEEKV